MSQGDSESWRVPAAEKRNGDTAVAPALEVSEISASYGDARVLRGVSMRVWEGKVTTLLGSNGAGKTTTLMALAGIVRTQAGTVRLFGNEIDEEPAYSRVRLGLGLVQEGKRIFRSRTVEQNLFVGRWIHRRRGRRAARRAIEDVYIRFPMLAERRHTLAGAMSGGQQQMLAIAQALMAEPRILMLDEPSAGLAPVIVQDVLSVVRGLREEGVGILLVEQMLEEALSVADHVVVISHGEVVLSGSSREINQRDAIRDAYL